jgi:hypothetical protein
MKLLLVSKAEQIDILKGMLEKAGITTEVTDDSTPLPGAEFHPRLWVVNDADFSRASAVLADFRKSPSSTRMAWRCPGCGEHVENQFSSCWKCGHEQPEGPLNLIEQEPAQQPPGRKQVLLNFLGAAAALVVAMASIWQLAVGRTHFSLYEFKGSGRVLDIYLPFLAVLAAALGLALLWRAVGLRRRMLERQYEPTA